MALVANIAPKMALVIVHLGSNGNLKSFDVNPSPPACCLFEITIGKIMDGNRPVDILRSTNIMQGRSGWNCGIWVQETLEKLITDDKVLGTNGAPTHDLIQQKETIV